MIDSQMGRRELIFGGLATLATARAFAGPGNEAFAISTTRAGRVRGATFGGVCVFRGVPYAGSVSGAARFKAPPVVQPWSGVRDALTFPPPSIQPGQPLVTPGRFIPPPAEDCLFVNVWTPGIDGKRRPVMFYNHGGGFTIGSGSGALQDGANLARQYDVVVVESNHRLGLLGYLYLGELLGPDYPGNQGLSDIGAAITWTHDNIAAFGGDPDNVMVFGESGGGAKTACCYAMPAIAPYFSKASIESAPAWRFTSTRAGAADTARATLDFLGIPASDARKILSVPVERLMEAQLKVGGALGPPPFGVSPVPSTEPRQEGFGPFVDGEILAAQPFDPGPPAFSANKPLIVGITSDEMVFFSLGDKSVFTLSDADMQTRLNSSLGAETDPILKAYRAHFPAKTPSQLYFRIQRDATLWANAILVAERKAAQHAAPVFVYELAYPSPTKVPGTDYPLGAPHAFDIPMKFDTIPPPGDGPPALFSDDQSAERKLTAKAMSEMWATFARTSQPGARDQPAWPAYSEARRATMFIDARSYVVDDPDQPLRLLWERYRR